MSSEDIEHIRPAISIVVPVFNVEKWVAACLRSLLNQTFSDIEIICVDDASSDASLRVLRETVGDDPRVKIIAFSENCSSSQARKAAVLASRGKYVTFVDGDDELVPDACEKLYAMMAADPADILNVSTLVINAGERSDKDAAAAERRLSPYDGRLFGEDILKYTLWEKKYPHNLCAKMFDGTLCRRAFAEVEDGFFPMAQDMYAYCILAFFAKSYRGVPGAFLYRYNYGIGVSTSRALTLEQFRRNCLMSEVCRALDEFFRRQQVAEELYRHIMDVVTVFTLQVGVNKWNDALPNTLKGPGLDMLLQYWGAARIVPLVFSKCRYKLPMLTPELGGSEVLAPGRLSGPVKTVGILYHSMFLGGVQRVICVLAKYYRELGCEVVLFTNQPPHDDDYELDERIRRVTLPPGDGNYQQRTAALLEAAAECHLDVMLYHAWGDPGLFWDMLTLKSAGVRFVVHTHSICSCLCTSSADLFSYLPDVYRYADLVIALSRVDEVYYAASGVRAKYLMNPVELEHEVSERESSEPPTLLWIGRISWEKRPLDAIRILAQVVKTIPNVRLQIVGKEKDGDSLTRQMLALIEKEQLTGNVELCGFQEEVAPYYRSGTLMLNTSLYEGYPISFVEAFLGGLPVVSYDMPYLEVARENRGWVGVASGEVNAAAAVLIDILSRPERLAELRAGAAETGKRLREADIREEWAQVFRQLEHGFPAELPDLSARKEDLRLLFATIRSHYRMGISSQRGKYDALNRNYTNLKNDLARGGMAGRPPSAEKSGHGDVWQMGRIIDLHERQLAVLLQGGGAKALSRLLATGVRLMSGMLLRPRRTARMVFELYTIADSRMFDAYYYLRGKEELSRSWTMMPLYHFCLCGWRQGHDPSAAFDLSQYQLENPDVEASDCNPLVHYVRHGRKEGRRAR